MEVKTTAIPIEEMNEVELVIPSIIIESNNTPESHTKGCQCRICEKYRREEEKKNQSICCNICDNDETDSCEILLFCCFCLTMENTNGDGCLEGCCDCDNCCEAD